MDLLIIGYGKDEIHKSPFAQKLASIYWFGIDFELHMLNKKKLLIMLGWEINYDYHLGVLGAISSSQNWNP